VKSSRSKGIDTRRPVTEDLLGAFSDQAILDQVEAAREHVGCFQVGLDRAAFDAAHRMARERLTTG
jgi:alkylation response protein AidB-like acyl-CoA dehydrogenase